MKSLRQLAVWAALCGTVALTDWVAAEPAGVGPLGIENSAAPIEDSPATSETANVAPVDGPQVTAPSEDGDNPVTAKNSISIQVDVTTSVVHLGSGGTALPDPTPPPSAPRLESLSTTNPLPDAIRPAVSSFEALDACPEPDVCIDQYLFSLYERTPKIDTSKVTEQIKVTVTKKGKTRTVVQTVTKYVTEDFAWKDPIAAQRVGMSLIDYVIGGMDRDFKRKLYHALRAMDDAGLAPGITSGFRDDYRQGIATGRKAATDSSYHGGSRRGGYGHGLAADLVSVKGETRAERFQSSIILWKWIDAHEKEFGIGRPYLDRDPPHVAPIDGKEYASKRGGAKAQIAGLKNNQSMTKRTKTAKR